MGRHPNENLEKALTMADNGMDFLKAWREAKKLPGGATSWGNALRVWNARVAAAEEEAAQQQRQTQQQAVAQRRSQKTPAKPVGKAPAAAAASTRSSATTAATAAASEREGPIVAPRVQRPSSRGRGKFRRR